MVALLLLLFSLYMLKILWDFIKEKMPSSLWIVRFVVICSFLIPPIMFISIPIWYKKYGYAKS